MKMKWLCIFSLVLNLGCQTSKKSEVGPVTDLAEPFYKKLDDRIMISIDSARLSQAEEIKLEKHLVKNPEDVETRIKLFGIYGTRIYKSEKNDQNTARAKQLGQMDWILSNRPLDPILLHFSIERDFEGHEAFKKKWMDLVKARPQDYFLRLSLARALRIYYRDTADQVLLEGFALFPNDIGLHQARFDLHNIKEDYVKQSDEDYKIAVEELNFLSKHVPKGLRRYKVSNDLVEYAYLAGDFKLAKTRARELLDEAVTKYNGPAFGFTAINTRTVLGLVAMEEKNYEAAKENLAKSVVDTPVSMSFGPTFVLAKKLLAAGERAAVRQYLIDYENIWSSGFLELEKWKIEIDKGQTPSFDKFDRYKRQTASVDPKNEH